ncbi:MAG: sec-independent protein translocase protein TatA [Thermoleophilaceae bacterium]|jgi:sec-independent protein translocase protein TatA|nr:sec-independent protein translocase protein TatA [Thermoleophilaceae bacterium]
MPNIGPLEIAVILVIVLLIFGPKRLPDLGRSMGRGMREFKDSVTGKDEEKAIEPGETVTTVKTTTVEDEAAPRPVKPADVS